MLTIDVRSIEQWLRPSLEERNQLLAQLLLSVVVVLEWHKV